MYVFVYCACVCAGDVMFVSILGKVRVYMYVHVCMFVCMYVCMYVCMWGLGPRNAGRTGFAFKAVFRKND